jgi:hypothetical protein
MEPGRLVEGTEDIPDLVFGRISFACPVCGEIGDHACVPGFQQLLEIDDTFALAVANIYLALNRVGALPISLRDLSRCRRRANGND